MTAWEYCKTQGVTMKQLSTVTEQSLETLNNWYRNPKKRKLFDFILTAIEEKLERDRK